MCGQTINVLLEIKEMKNNYLDKVLDQIVSETRIDYDKERLYTPFFSAPFHLLHFRHLKPHTTSPLLLRLLRRHCKEVYGLNDDEIDYVWEEYKKIIKDKIR